MVSKRPALTSRQADILAFIAQQLQQSGRPPTRAEIAEHFGFAAAASAQEHLHALVKKGYIALDAGRSRGLKLLKDPHGKSLALAAGDALTPGASDLGAGATAGQPGPNTRDARFAVPRLPLIGEVRAGQPMLAAAHVEQDIALQASLFSPKADFLLRVRGDSMCNAGILEGDYLGVHKTDTARTGQIVVARVGDEVTVKTLRMTPTQVLLMPANPNYQPLSFALNDPSFAIEGIVVGVIRRLKN
jgi:repressor LexA